MDNYEIAHNFSMLSKLMDIHGENSFKSKSYSITAYNIENLTVQLNDLPKIKFFHSRALMMPLEKKLLNCYSPGN